MYLIKRFNFLLLLLLVESASVMAENPYKIGNAAGAVYFTSTAGGIFSTFLLGFYLIPQTGLRISSGICSAALVALPLLFYTPGSFKKKGQAETEIPTNERCRGTHRQPFPTGTAEHAGRQYLVQNRQQWF